MKLAGVSVPCTQNPPKKIGTAPRFGTTLIFETEHALLAQLREALGCMSIDLKAMTNVQATEKWSLHERSSGGAYAGKLAKGGCSVVDRACGVVQECDNGSVSACSSPTKGQFPSGRYCTTCLLLTSNIELQHNRKVLCSGVTPLGTRAHRDDLDQHKPYNNACAGMQANPVKFQDVNALEFPAWMCAAVGP